MTKRPTCNTCKYWNDPASTGTGFCQRRAPTPDSNGEAPRFPVTYSTDWCGEHSIPPMTITRDGRIDYSTLQSSEMILPNDLVDRLLTSVRTSLKRIWPSPPRPRLTRPAHGGYPTYPAPERFSTRYNFSEALHPRVQL